jgi:probable F420-dependent oxidoreductase
MGFEGLYYGDHIAVPMVLKTPYPGKLGYHGRVTQLECFGVLSHLAAVTKTIRLATGVAVLPIRHPLQTARAVTTLDNLSNGRFDLMVGTGSIRDEFEAMGEDYDTRWPRLNECLDIFNCLWCEDEPSFDGEFYRFEPIGFEPKPVQKPGPPVFMGSHAPRGLRSAAIRAQGWYGNIKDPAKLREIRLAMEPLLNEAGRDPGEFRYKLIHASGVDDLPTPDDLAAYRREGAESITISPFALEETQAMEKLERVAVAFKDFLD